ncbi:WSC domain-containing protein [Podospora didyma]|uniref:WSC domain-containing protein n=1 Tax=Podospora didyma TaxID=330526 RepID=A0AAE0KK80_9PEZI|nr:WSC domain-containing protein [Podospora didyma]
MRPFGLVHSLLSLALSNAAWGWHPTDSLMEAGKCYRKDSAAVGYLPNHNMDPATLAGGAFGQIWSFTGPTSSVGIGEQFFAKPLVFTPRATGRQVVIAFSEQNRIYVLDAVNGTLYKMRDMATESPAEPPFMVSDLNNCNDISGTIGITGTPVIDNVTETIYFWAKGYKTHGVKGWQNAAYRFHAVDAWTLQERPGFPTNIEGLPADNDKTRIFTGGNVLQRTALNLINDVVYAGFGGHCDLYNYTGWVVGMRASTGDFVTSYSTNGGDRSPKQDGTWTGGGGGCGIWQSGAPLSSDNAGRLFFVTGNGYKTTVNQQSSASGRVHLDTLSECIVNMAIDPVTGVVTQQDYFEPYTYLALDSTDRDLGGGGVSILPFGGGGVNRLAATAGKNGQCYITNADNLGGYKMAPGGGDAIIQTITPPTGTAMFANVGAYPLEGGYLYMTPVGSPTYVYALGADGNGKPAFSLAGQTPDKSTGRVGTGSATITTLNGQPGTGILWLSDPDNGIRAYNAVPNNGVLTRITLPPTPVLPKFQRPVFGNGRYYTTTYQGAILGFGSPVQLPFDCNGPFDFGEVAIGSSSTIDVTCTARIKINKIANLTIGNALYNASFASLPQGVINAGQSFTFPVTFNLTGYVLRSGSTSAPSVQPGVQSGSISLVTVNSVTGYSTQQPLSVTGNTITSSPFAAINPVSIDFQPLVIGSASAVGGSESAMVIQNLGKTPMKILGYAFTIDSPTSAGAQFTNITQGANGTYRLDANGFFTTEDLPSLDSTIAAGSSVIVHMRFLCNTLGIFYTTFTLWTDGGIAYTVLTGSANSQPIALLEISTAEGGWNTIPPCPDPNEACPFQLDMGTSSGLTTVERIIRITNKGGSDLIVDKSKPPLGSVLGATNPSTDFSEGQVIRPGKSGSAAVFFTPGSASLNSDAVIYSGAWTLNVNDLSFGVHVLNFTGTLQGTQVGPTLPNGLPRFKYLGCYKDSPAARIETTMTNLASNSNGACQQYAITSKASFAATEYTTECWVGRNIPAPGLKVADYLCLNYICPGDKTQFCGGVGSYALMWYDSTGYFPENNTLSAEFRPPAYKPTVGNYVYAGCRTDTTAARALGGKTVGAATTRTIESCAAACSGFTYFGVEYGTECFCGNTINAASAVALESSCSYTCGGDPTELCGGSSRISVYALNGTVVNLPSSSSSSSSSSSTSSAPTSISKAATLSLSSTSVTSSAAPTGTPSNSAKVGQYSFLECHTDTVAARALNDKNTQSETMSAETCAEFCSGYTYFGLEYSQECFCGNTLLDGTTAATDGRCSMVCAGNPLQICGGPDGLSLYKLGAGVVSSSSTAASISSTVSATLSVSASLPTSTTSTAPPPQVTVVCPTNDGAVYTSSNGKTFLLECYIDHFGGDLTMKYVSSYAACAETCSTTATCVAFSWQPGMDSPCYMKSSVGAANPNNGVWGAKIVVLPSSSSSSLSSASSSSSSLLATTTAASSTSSSSLTSSSVTSTGTSTRSSTTSSVSSSSSSASSSTTSVVSTSRSSSSPTSVTLSSTSRATPSSISSSSSSSVSSTSTSSSVAQISSSSGSSSSSATRVTTSSSSSTSSLSQTSTLTSSSGSSSTRAPTSSSMSTSSVGQVPTSSTSSSSAVTQTTLSSRSSKPTSSSLSTSSSAQTSVSSSSNSSSILRTTSSVAVGTASISSISTSRATTSSSSSLTSPAIPTPTLEAWTYAGCANDTTTVRALNGTSVADTSMTVSTCQQFCSSKGYGLAGVEYSTQCYCGLEIAPGFTYDQTGCNMACGGNGAEMCGGKSRLNIYRNTTFVQPRVIQTTPVSGSSTQVILLLGCYVDSSTARVLNKFTWTPTSGVSVESCAAKCTSKGFQISGVEFGGECYCGSNVPSLDLLAPSLSDCKAKLCNGDLSQFCGGSKRLLVYSTG